MIDLYFKPTKLDAKKPVKAHPRDAGFDLYATEDIILHPKKQQILSSGIAVQGRFVDPEDAKKWIIQLQIKGTSGNAAKLGLTPIGGVVDEGYTGEIGVIAVNTTDIDIEIKNGKKIAQLVPEVLPNIRQVHYLGLDDEFPKTDRGDDGFGSTGVAS